MTNNNSFTPPECLDCGNKELFNIPLRGWETRRYTDDGHLFKITESEVEWYGGEQVSCVECDSTNVWGDF